MRILAVSIYLTLFVAACSSGGNSNQSNTPGQGSAETSEPVMQTNVQVTVEPALTPNFQPSIHDYVVNCNSSPSVEFTAQIGPEMETEVNGVRVEALALTAQATIPLVAGQRFTFGFRKLPLAHTRFSDPSEYSVRCLPTGFPPISTSVAGVSQAQWYVFSPGINGYPPPFYVIVADTNGTPVWWMAQAGGATPFDAKIIGQNMIVWTYGDGDFEFRSFSGEVLNILGPDLDLHDLQPTPAGTYLVIRDVPRVCPPDCADMSPWGGSAQAAVIDAEILEMDSQSNVIWTWRTRDHIDLSETGTQPWFPSVGNDIIHMNAVEPDGEDALLFSARHLNAIYHINKRLGTIDWKLGGSARGESLTVIGDTRPTAIGATGQVLSGQHDVRLLADRTVTVHDNGTDANRPPFAMRYVIDEAARTSEVLEAIQDPRATFSLCCGSARRLPDGNWLMQWGYNPYLTELDPSGNPVVTIFYNLGAAFSYRAVPVLPGVVDADQLRQGMDAMAPAISSGVPSASKSN